MRTTSGPNRRGVGDEMAGVEQSGRDVGVALDAQADLEERASDAARLEDLAIWLVYGWLGPSSRVSATTPVGGGAATGVVAE